MITTLFLGFVALMTAVIVALSARYRNGRFAFGDSTQKVRQGRISEHLDHNEN